MKAKLTSRKFWMAVAAFAVGVLALFGADANTTQQISGVIMSLGAVIAYIVGEGLIDAASVSTNVIESTYTDGNITSKTRQPAGEVIGTVDSVAAESAPTGAAQAASVKKDTALSD